MNFKNFLGTANKGLGKLKELKGFIMKNLSPQEESQPTETSQGNKPENSSTSQNTKPPQNQTAPPPEKSPQKDEPKEPNTIIKSSKGQFDFSVEDDDEEIKPKKNTNEPDITEENYEYSEPQEDNLKIGHRLYLKNSMMDIEPLPYVPFIKIKKNENILSLIGIGKKKPFKEVKYFAVFAEHFLYMINMTNKDNNQNNFFKKVGNHYDLTKISNIEIKEDEILPGKRLIKLEFLNDNDGSSFNTINKEFHLEKNDAIKFFAILKFYLKKNWVPLVYKDEFEEEEDEDEEEEEDDDEEDKKEDKENTNKEEGNKEKSDDKEEKKKEQKEDENKKENKEKEIKEEDKKEEKEKEDKKEENKVENKEENKEEKKEEEKKKEN